MAFAIEGSFSIWADQCRGIVDCLTITLRKAGDDAYFSGGRDRDSRWVIGPERLSARCGISSQIA